MKHINNRYLRTSALTLAVAAVSFAGFGCEDDSGLDEAREAGGDAAEAVNDEKQELLGDAAEKLGEAKGTVEEMGENAQEMAEEMGVSLDNLDEIDFSALGEGQMTDMLDKAQTAIGEGRIDQAKGLIEKLEGMRDKLPESVVAKLDSVKTMLDKAGSMGDAAKGLMGAE